MKEVKFPNGYVGIYDDTLQIGDIVSAYHAGYHRITRIEPRNTPNDGGVPLIHYKTVCKSDGTPVKGNVERCCDAAYVRLARLAIDNELAYLKASIEKLEKFKEAHDDRI